VVTVKAATTFDTICITSFPFTIAWKTGGGCLMGGRARRGEKGANAHQRSHAFVLEGNRCHIPPHPRHLHAVGLRAGSSRRQHSLPGPAPPSVALHTASWCCVTSVPLGGVLLLQAWAVIQRKCLPHMSEHSVGCKGRYLLQQLAGRSIEEMLREVQQPPQPQQQQKQKQAQVSYSILSLPRVCCGGLPSSQPLATPCHIHVCCRLQCTHCTSGRAGRCWPVTGVR
jgi:hypothetical protein